ncbi:hypothetical protein JG687_00018859 [Phytophthora cactorum]|uniref:Uncharacterized protein n=1 Tax=Phytophthora cactorum TaxID=29920 RepID=A0A8T1TMS9_9STRA|nr:hypothetical protein JG687_00018859 [Phytophthora cactorum]
MDVVNMLKSICWTSYAALVSNMFFMASTIAGSSVGFNAADCDVYLQTPSRQRVTK